jgi:V/A-type H+-transporting ATPase subunit D
VAEFKLTKNALREQQVLKGQLERYLPTLQLKKAMLQSEINEVRAEILQLQEAYHKKRLDVSQFSGLFSENIGYDMTSAVKVDKVKKRYENVAGVDLPFFEGVTFMPFEYPLFTTPAWLDPALLNLREMVTALVQVLVAEEKKAALEKEFREVSIRVNLFEKNLIPKAKEYIRRIKIFLEDQQLGAVGQAKVAKAKILKKKALKAVS